MIFCPQGGAETMCKHNTDIQLAIITLQLIRLNSLFTHPADTPGECKSNTGSQPLEQLNATLHTLASR